ncbi:hypothetical protein ASE23_15730 [Rhizobium sp. Root73]|uniref:hypothetical protein n=1 Tax=unclassified Rhizobium TaxID=2613769 RepID=UPI0007266A34|nr:MULTISPECIES: hypothetical protein [unclassified Rhizobium]KQY18167.1 hypothetical protein ASD36_06170 [Rhizobium sp. Root1334]KRB98468.1 hypothetical protein ASE23_15730 [Rhizobium sp. Root73]
MTTAAKMFEKLSESLNRPFSSIEAYGLALSKFGWWSASKRGRGASPRSVMDGAKLLLAILANGPSELANRENGVESFFLDYANLVVAPNIIDEPWVKLVMSEMGLAKDAGFLDFLAALLSLHISNEVDRVVFYSPDPEGFHGDDVVYEGPHIEARIKGPTPAAGIRFMLSHAILDRLKAEGHDVEPLLGEKEITFVHRFFALLIEAQKKGDEREIESFAGAIRVVAECTGRGIGFERFFGAMQFEAIASAFRDASDSLEAPTEH